MVRELAKTKCYMRLCQNNKTSFQLTVSTCRSHSCKPTAFSMNNLPIKSLRVTTHTIKNTHTDTHARHEKPCATGAPTSCVGAPQAPPKSWVSVAVLEELGLNEPSDQKDLQPALQRHLPVVAVRGRCPEEVDVGTARRKRMWGLNPVRGGLDWWIRWMWI